MALVAGDQGLITRIAELGGATRLPGDERGQALSVWVKLPTEAAAGHHLVDAHAALGQPQYPRDLLPVEVRVLSGRPNGDPSRRVARHQRDLRLHIGVLNPRIEEPFFYNYCGVSKCRLHVAAANFEVSSDVSSGMYLRRTGLHRLERIQNRSQRLVLHHDLGQRLFRGALAFRRHQRHGVAHIPHHVATKDRLVLDDGSHRALPGDVLSSEDSDHSRAVAGSGRVDGADMGMRVRASEHLTVNHPWKGKIVGVLRFTHHLAPRIHTWDWPANDFVVVAHDLLSSAKGFSGSGDGLHDAYIAGAAAKVSRHSEPNILLCGVGLLFQEKFGRHDHPGSAKTALDSAVIDKGLL